MFNPNAMMGGSSGSSQQSGTSGSGTGQSGGGTTQLGTSSGTGASTSTGKLYCKTIRATLHQNMSIFTMDGRTRIVIMAQTQGSCNYNSLASLLEVLKISARTTL